MKTGSWFAMVLGGLLLLSGLSACVRTDSFAHFRQLERELQAARELKADRYVASAYDYWFAVECLEKAKTEHSYSDFGYSEAIAQDGLKAVERAKVAAAAGGKLVEEPTPEALAAEKRRAKMNVKGEAKPASVQAPADEPTSLPAAKEAP